MKLKSHFNFNRSQRSGILSFLALIFILLAVLLFVDFKKEAVLDIDSPKVLAMQSKLDSLRVIKTEKS